MQPTVRPKKLVNRAHPFAVARRQIVVDGDDMDAAAGEGVEINGHGGHQGFAFAGGHFRDLALVQRDGADQLHVEGDHFPLQRMFADDDFRAAEAAAGVFDHGVGFRQNVIEPGGQRLRILDWRQFGLPLRGFLAQNLLGLRLQGRFVVVDPFDQRPQLLHVAVVS